MAQGAGTRRKERKKRPDARDAAARGATTRGGSAGVELALDERSGEAGRAYEARLARSPEGARARKAGGVHYTPMWLARAVTGWTLEPMLRRQRARLRCGGSRWKAGIGILRLRVLDPACGSGNFLLAAHELITRELMDVLGVVPSERTRKERVARAVARRCLFGVDIDPRAVQTARTALAAAAGGDGRESDAPTRKSLERHVVVGNALDWRVDGAQRRVQAGGFDWGRRFVESRSSERFLGSGPFDAVIGNPPFLSQLKSGTTLNRDLAKTIAGWSGGAVKRYADPAGAFLLLATILARRGGRVGMVLPRSLLVTRDAEGVRRRVADLTTPRALWTSDVRVFDAAVDTCALVAEISRPRHGWEGAVSEGHRLHRYEGAEAALHAEPARTFAPAEWAGPTWGPLASDAVNAPWCPIPAGQMGTRMPVLEQGLSERRPGLEIRRMLRDVALATADFRDQYYGLRGAIVENRDLRARKRDGGRFPRVITCGSIDLAHERWGERPTRIHGRVWEAPRADLSVLEREAALGRWARSRLVPKVLLATQTRVLEVIVDEDGTALPCTPVITLVPTRGLDLWRLAAAVASPVACAIAMRDYGGAALSASAIKLSAKQTLTLPVPEDDEAWTRGGDALRRASVADSPAARALALAAFASVMVTAYGLPADQAGAIERWWIGRLPTSREERNDTKPSRSRPE